MILTQEEYAFIESIQKKFPDKKILENFEQFLNTPPENRRGLADKKLQELPRTGYVLRGVPIDDVETVFEHVEGMVDLAIEVIPSGLSLNLLVAIIRAHDIGEAIVGDFTPHDMAILTKEEKKQLEYLAVKIISESDPQMLDHWHEYEDGTSPEGLLAKDLDKLQMYKQSIAYGQSHPDIDLTDIQHGVEQKYQWVTETGRALFVALRIAGPRIPYGMKKSLKPN